jgi:hypothetical protein
VAIEYNRAFGGASALKACEAAAGFMLGRPLGKGEVVVEDGAPITDWKSSWDAMQRGSPFTVVHRRWDKLPERGRIGELTNKPHPPATGSWPWRARNEFRPTADSVNHRLKLWRSAPLSNENARWLASMARIMRICFAGLEGRAEFAATLAADIGEKDYFDEVLRPILRDRAARRALGLDKPLFDLVLLTRIIFPRPN